VRPRVDALRQEVGALPLHVLHQQEFGVGQQPEKQIGHQPLPPHVRQQLRHLPCVELEERGVQGVGAGEVERHDTALRLGEGVREERLEVGGVAREGLCCGVVWIEAFASRPRSRKPSVV
jgi:hypothetical protein